MRAVQLLPATRYTAAEKGDRLALGAHAEHSLALQVHAGATLEVTLAQVRSRGSGLLDVYYFITFWKAEGICATSSCCRQVTCRFWWQHILLAKCTVYCGLWLLQLWSSLGESVLEVDVCFHGITATPSALFIDGGAAWSQTMIRRAHSCEAPHVDIRRGTMHANRHLHPELDCVATAD